MESQVWESAKQAGYKAFEGDRPTPMVVGTPANGWDGPLDPHKPIYVVEDGLCGFAWVTIKPARGSFVSYLKSKGIGSKAYGGGWQIWASEFAPSSQSYSRKLAAASAVASVLKDHGINAYADGRLD